MSGQPLILSFLFTVLRQSHAAGTLITRGVSQAVQLLMRQLSFVTGLNDSAQECGKLIRIKDAHHLAHCFQQVRHKFVSRFILVHFRELCPWYRLM